MSNVTPIRPDPYGERQLASDNGPLSQLMRGLGVKDELAPIPVPKRIDVTPDLVGIPIGRHTPRECVCPTCRIFEKEADADMCPKCTLRSTIRGAKVDEQRRHFESVDRENRVRAAERKVVDDARMIQAASDLRTLQYAVDEWDPDWRDHYGTWPAAEAAYLRAKGQP